MSTSEPPSATNTKSNWRKKNIDERVEELEKQLKDIQTYLPVPQLYEEGYRTIDE